MITAVNRALLWLFLFFVFFVHYETTLAFGTLHSWVLFIGMVWVVPQIALNCIRSNYSLPIDYALVGLLVVFLFLGFVFNLRDAQFVTLKAYLLSIATYVFVRETMPVIRLQQFYTLNAIFLIGNSLLMVLQLATGDFYPARPFAAGSPELMITSGFADGPTKNGMIHAAAVAVLFSRAIFLKPRLFSLNSLALVLGTGTLLLTTSRAGVVASLVAILFNIVLLIGWKKKFGARSVRVVRGVAVLATACLMLYVGSTYLMSPSAQTVQRAQTRAGQYASGIVQMKFIPKDGDLGTLFDGSMGHRLTIYRTLPQILGQNPLKLPFGIGMGVFSLRFAATTTDLNLAGGGASTHNSWLEFLVEGGLIAWGIWLCLTAHVIRRALGRPNAVTVVPVLSALVSTMAFMLFHDVLRGRMYWLPLGILGAFAYAHAGASWALLGARRRVRVSSRREEA